MGCISSVPSKYADVGPQKDQGNLVLQSGATPIATAGPSRMEVLFFPDAKLPCHNVRKPGGCRRPNCSFAHEPTSLSRLLDILNSATRTMDIAVFNFTLDDLADAVLAAHRRGVKIRIITDADQVNNTGNDIPKFKAAGIPVHANTGRAGAHGGGFAPLMHHKFAVIDGQLLLTGSFNWTRQAVVANDENLLVTNQAPLVAEYRQRFEAMWHKYS